MAVMRSPRKSRKKGKLTAELLRRSLLVAEFITRFVLCNIPSYLHAKSPGFDSICSMLFAYLTFEVVGFTGAVLANALFSVAFRVSGYLSYFIVFDDNSSDLINRSYYSTFQMLAQIYVSYASLRMMVSFAQSVFQIALESIKDFPSASRLLAQGGRFTLKLAYLVFIPVLILEIYLLCADSVCNFGHHSRLPFNLSTTPFIQSISQHAVMTTSISSARYVCDYTGLHFFTRSYIDIRTITFGSLVVMVLQLWQSALIQFPRWDLAFRDLTPFIRTLSQLSLVGLTVSSLVTLAFPVVKEGISLTTLTFLLVGWTLWLCLFIPVLVNRYGAQWEARVTTSSLQSFAATLRVSFIIIVTVAFFLLTSWFGYVRAQLDVTFITIALPTLYCSIYILVSTFLYAGRRVMFYGLPLTLFVALCIDCFIRSGNAQAADTGGSSSSGTSGVVMGGYGSVILVWTHLMTKVVHLYGEGEFSSTASAAAKMKLDTEGLIEKEQHLLLQQQQQSQQQQQNGSILLPPPPPPHHHHQSLSAVTSAAAVASVTIIPSPLLTSSTSSSPRCEVCNNSSNNNNNNDNGYNHNNNINNNNNSNENGHLYNHNASNNINNNDNSNNNSNNGSCNSINTTLDSKLPRRPSSESLSAALANRGNDQSPLVSLNLSKSLSSHILVKISQKVVELICNVTSVLTSSDSIVSSIVRAFTGIVIVVALIIVTLTLASFTQKKLQLFPKLTDFMIHPETSHIIFDHKIANVTLYPHYNIHNDPNNKRTNSNNNNNNNNNRLKSPNYAVCDFKWQPTFQPPSTPMKPSSSSSSASKPNSKFSFANLFQPRTSIVPAVQIVTSAAVAAQTIESTKDTNMSDKTSSSSLFEKASLLETPYLSIIDFALLSELAYYDQNDNDNNDDDDDDILKNRHNCNNTGDTIDVSSTNTSTTTGTSTAAAANTMIGCEPKKRFSLQEVTDVLFPHLDFQVVTTATASSSSSSSSSYSTSSSPVHFTSHNHHSGPVYVELYSAVLDITIIAVRGTNVGRFQDFLEDIKLYTEPVLFTMLDTVFPTIRLWTPDLTSRVIEWLYSFNSFMGMQIHSEYYTPLVARVLEIKSTKHRYDDSDNNNNHNNNDDNDNTIINNNSSSTSDDNNRSNNHANRNQDAASATTPERVIITGHSLGGGLANIVGTLTGVRSITFSSPGLGLSYRKYKFHHHPSTTGSSSSSSGSSSSNDRTSSSNNIDKKINIDSRQDNNHNNDDDGDDDGMLVLSADSGSIHHRSVSVITEFDIISRIDRQVGFVQTLQCDNQAQVMDHSCHHLEGHICHLIEHCGDYRFAGCKYEVPSLLMDTVKSHSVILIPILAVGMTMWLLAIIPDIL